MRMNSECQGGTYREWYVNLIHPMSAFSINISGCQVASQFHLWILVVSIPPSASGWEKKWRSNTSLMPPGDLWILICGVQAFKRRLESWQKGQAQRSRWGWRTWTAPCHRLAQGRVGLLSWIRHVILLCYLCGCRWQELINSGANQPVEQWLLVVVSVNALKTF